MSHQTRDMRKLLNKLNEARDTDPLGHVPNLKKSHIVKKPEEEAKEQAIQKLQDVINYINSVEELDGYTKHNLLTRAEEIVKKILS